MRVLLSTIGSRGDVQPLLALALALRELGQEVRLCAPPDFAELSASFAVPMVAIGPALRPLTAAALSGVEAPRLSPEQRKELGRQSVVQQFDTIGAAADGCDVILAGGALQFAARSVAEVQRIRYVYASYCPITLPSPHHAPPRYGAGLDPSPPVTDNRTRWAQDAARLHASFGATLNAQRARLGLPAVEDLQSHMFGAQPWLAADPTLAPWPEGAGVVQTGAWMLEDVRPLAPGLQAFLDQGEPPIYFGLGSMRAPRELGHELIAAARALGRRAILSRGWAGLSLLDDGCDCLAIDEVNQQRLFARVAAVVHHGGAGTTTAAARAGSPQVIMPQMYDQPYFAARIEQLGIGRACTRESLPAALAAALQPDVGARASTLAAAIVPDGARSAALRLMTDP